MKMFKRRAFIHPPKKSLSLMIPAGYPLLPKQQKFIKIHKNKYREE